MSRWRLDWPWPAGGEPVGTGTLKSCAEDFQVTEILDLEGVAAASRTEVLTEAVPVPGQGEHLLIYLEKTGDNTVWVAGELGRLAGCGSRGVGYCGLKDRNAVTRQWFSVQRPGQETSDTDFLLALQNQHDNWKVLAVARYHRKLRNGEHQANRFDIRLRQLTGDTGEIQQCLEALQRDGCPNYFGRQRFGYQGANLDQAVAPAEKSARRRRGRRGMDKQEGIYFSAARSWLFNEVLAERVVRGDWNQPLQGEPGEQPTGPLWGDGGTLATGEQGELERTVVARYPEMAAVFSTTRMSPARRPLVLHADELHWSISEAVEQRWLDLSFTLLPGQYATTLLASVLDLDSSE